MKSKLYQDAPTFDRENINPNSRVHCSTYQEIWLPTPLNIIILTNVFGHLANLSYVSTSATRPLSWCCWRSDHDVGRPSKSHVYCHLTVSHVSE